MSEMNLAHALNDALAVALDGDDRVVLLGEDIGLAGGVFRVTDGLLERFGSGRVIDTPVAESGIVGAAFGMAVAGLRPVAEIQFLGFSYPAYDQIVSHVGRIRNRSNHRFTAPLVIRIPYGGGIGAAEHHSESNEAIYAHTPGVKVVVPSSPTDAKGLLLAAIADPDPVIFLEPIRLYRAVKEEVPEGHYTVPIGAARVVGEGTDVTLISYGATMRPTLEAADDLTESDGASIEIIDLLTVSPMDTETIVQSVSKTGRAVMIHEAPRSCGIGAEVVARIVENCLMHLHAPIRRVTGFDVQFPYFARERAYMVNAERIAHAAREVLAF